MILINLLPHREARRRERKRAFFIGVAASVVAGVVLSALWYAVLVRMTSSQEARNAFLKSEIAVLERQIKDIATLREDIDALKARQKAVEDLQTDRNVPVYLLDELVAQTPEGVYLTTIKQTGGTVSLTGVAQTNERVSEFLRNTSNQSQWLERPELIEIKAVSGAGGTVRDPRRMFEFGLRLSLKRPQAAAPEAPKAGKGT